MSIMKRKYSEEKVLKKLDIPDFSHMTIDKVPKFASMMMHMDKNSAKMALEQFPDFKDFSLELVNQFKGMLDRILDDNAKSEDAFYKACSEIITALHEELKRDDIDADDRKRIEDKMIYVANMISEKDREGKKFKMNIANIFAFCGLVALAMLFSGGSNNEIEADYTPADSDDYMDIDDIHDL